ncbi:MAG: helix-turn-helix domain-containing protein [Psychromonas sp.]
MTCLQSINRILIISNDSFMVGLLTGYCVAHNFILKCIPRSCLLDGNKVSSGFKLIIIDLRDITSLQIEAHLEPLKNINNQYATHVCAIHNHSEKSLSQIPSWVDCFQDENFIEELNDYIDKYAINFIDDFSERRNGERRSEADRRTLSSMVTPFSSNQFNGKAPLLNAKDNHQILGIFKIDKDYQSVYLKGKDLELTRKEFKLFKLLAEDPGRVYTTEKIISHLWPDRARANKSDLYQYMHLLRKKVELDPDNPRWILTIKGVGYKLNVMEAS